MKGPVIFWGLCSIVCWVLAVITWLHHNDHMALMWFAFSILTSNAATAALKRWRV